MGSVSAAATAGMTTASERLERLAARPASAEGAADATVARVQMAASVAVARTANAMMGTLLDLMA